MTIAKREAQLFLNLTLKFATDILGDGLDLNNYNKS